MGTSDKEIKVTGKPGRTNSYTKEKAVRFCESIASGKTIHQTCREHDDMPLPSTIGRWLMKYEWFFTNYMEAKAIQTQVNADELLEIADNTPDDSSIAVQKARLQIDTRKWLAMKLLPKIYGENNNTFLLSGNTKVQIDNSILQAIADTVKQGEVIEAEVVEGSVVTPLLGLPKVAASQATGDCDSNPLDKVPPSSEVSPPQARNVPDKKG